MLDSKFKTAHARKSAFEFFLNIGFVIGKLFTQVGADFLFLFFIIYNTDTSENNDAVDI